MLFWYHTINSFGYSFTHRRVGTCRAVQLWFLGRFRRKGMVIGPKKTLLQGLLTLVIVVFLYGPMVYAAENSPTPDQLQPAALQRVGITSLKQLDPTLTGDGVKIAAVCRSFTYIEDVPQNDYRPDLQHNCLRAKDFIFHDDPQLPAGISPHSTAICSILFGRDANAIDPELGRFNYEGLTPDADAEVYEFWYFLINNVFGGLAPDADIITASIGDGFEHWWTRGIESLAEQYGIIIVASIGNGSNAHDPLLYPGAGANVIGVGVVDAANVRQLSKALANFALAYPQHSSFGPTVDGRCKPDIVAPGNCLAAVVSEPNRYEATGNWSSFSTPIVAGTIGLLVQKARQEPNLAPAVTGDGSNCVFRAILMNSATKLPYWHKGRLSTEDDHESPLDWIQGAGMLNAAKAYQQLTAGIYKPGKVAETGWDLNQLDNDQNIVKVYRFSVNEPAGKVITATAVWNKHYEKAYPFRPRPETDSDLRLELWAIDQNDPNSGYLLDYSDSPVDNVEHIYFKADPNYKDYEIVVLLNDANNPDHQKSEQYALAWSVTDRVADNNDILWYDLNADGIVNEHDITIFIENWMASINQSGDYVLGDINGDGIIDIADLDMFMRNINLKAEWREG